MFEKGKEFIEFVLKLLVDYPEELNVNVEQGERSIVFKINANNADYGKIIGRQGKSINSIRILLSVVFRNTGKRSAIDILDKEKRANPSPNLKKIN